MKTLISIAGGGMRGIGAVRLLREWESRSGVRVADVAHLIGGTSTGGIIAACAAAGLSMREVERFYYGHGPKIFRSNLVRRISSGSGMLGPRYSADGLSAALADVLGSRLLADLRTRAMFTALADGPSPVMIKSWSEEWRDLPAALAAAMTAAAPTYFPPVTIMHGGRRTSYADGGLLRNAPQVCVLTEALRLWTVEEQDARQGYTLIHLGTGRSQRDVPLPASSGLAWAARLHECMSGADDAYDDYQCRWMAATLGQFGVPVKLYRFDFSLPKFPPMDDASASTLDDIADAAWQAAVGQWADFAAVLDLFRAVPLDKLTVAR